MFNFVYMVVFSLAAISPIPPRIDSRAEPLTTSSERLPQIQKCREGILDPQARPEERRRWIDMLFSYENSEAAAVAVELLSMNSRPDCQRPICAAIAENARAGTLRSSPLFVNPLLSLLGADSEDLRAAASRALADFPEAGVPDKLGKITEDETAPLSRRLAAIDALAPNIHRQEVVRQLLTLDRAGVPEITAQVKAILEPLAARVAGTDWQAWWEERAKLPPTDWLADQLQTYRDRLRRSTGELDAIRSDAEREQSAVVKRVADFQREILRALPPEQRDTRLVEWMDDPLATVKLATFSLLRSRIADEGKRPEGETLNALLRQLKCESPIVRREVVGLVANLSDPSVVDAIIARLGEERDAGTHLALLQAAGKLGSAASVPLLSQEINDPNSSAECVRETASALAQIAGKPESRDAVSAISATLEQRYVDAPADQLSLRAALLSALAAGASSAYLSDFESALDSDDPNLLQAALSGIRALRSATKLPRCRVLVAHADPRVRKAALGVLGTVGRDDADVDAALSRMNPTIEASEPARQAAWRAFREVLGRRSVHDRVAAAEKLNDMPDYQSKYLEELANVLSMAPEPSMELEGVRDKLAGILIASGKDGEAVPHLRELYELRFVRSEPSASATGLRWLNAALKAPSYKGLSNVVLTLAEAASSEPAEKAQIIREVSQYIDSLSPANDVDRSHKLIVELRTVPSDLLGDAWPRLLDACTTKFQLKNQGPERERSISK
ncbi:MAG: HEAT repeat domain-containing protein [Planctomycetes bacterium]|nr:HEAT repeat domain-containing protein [Planctomycetota bacterium]MBI3836258.1 HEAT repeat domain-containing protein [Planctomycetota bacterium]